MKTRMRWLVIGLVAGLTVTAWAEIKTVTVIHSALQGIGAEKGVMRRDPSDIIKVGDLYYVWYSKGKISPGYDATIWYATTLDGHTMAQKGEGARALQLSFIASAVGGVFGVLLLIFLTPLLAQRAAEEGLSLFLMGGAEAQRNEETDVEKKLYPGGAFDPRLVTEALAPIDDIRADAPYRATAAAELVRRALAELT